MKDLTVGKPMKVIWLFAVPMILGQIAQQLYSFTDSAIVGNYVSSQALAAVGATSVISNMIIGFLNSGTMGLAIPIAKYYGAKDYHNMRRCIGASAIMTLLASIVLTVLSLIFYKAYPGTSQNTRRHIGYGSKLRYNHNRWNHILFII